jgi:hypothetical protein
MKLIILALCTFIAFSVTYLRNNFLHSSAKCLIPKGYSGNIYIIYDQPNGSDEEYDDKSRVYRIPANGVLFTKFTMETNTDDQQYYYVTSEGESKKIIQVSTGDFNESWAYIKNPKEPSRDDIVIIDGGVIWSMISANNNYEYQHAFIGTYKQFTLHKEFSLSYIDSLQKNYCKCSNKRQRQTVADNF